MKTTKRALFSSVMALILCFSMLVGTTFAWFTDSVESGVNQIVAGNLDVEVYNGLDTSAPKVDTATKLFDEIKYWEPGVVAYENLTVANLGNLALKYQLSVNFDNATANVNGDTLAKVLKVGFVEGGIRSTTREGALAEVTEWLPLASFAQPGELAEQNETNTYGIVIYWEPSDIDNDFNMNNGKGGALSIDLGIKLVATQLDAEFDSFGPDYDEDAWHPDMFVTTAAELAKAIEAIPDGGIIALSENLTFDQNSATSSGGSWYEGLYYVGDKSFTIDLNGKTIAADSAVNDYLMLFKNDGEKANTITIKNGTLEAASTAFCALCTSTTSTQKITINLENVNLIGNNSNGSVAKIRGGAELNVKAGTVITGKDSYLGIENWQATVNIYDGAEIYQNGTSSYNGCLVGVGGNGTVNVYGGYGKGVAGGFIAMTSGGTINVYGGEWIADTDGTFSGNDYVLIAQSDKNTYPSAGNSVVNVTGGTFKGGYNCYGNAVGDAQINISGGNFNTDPAAYVAAGYKALQAGGMYYVVADTIDSVVSTAAELATAIANSGVVYVADDIDMANAWTSVKPNGELTIIGNGNTITNLNLPLLTGGVSSKVTISGLTVADSTVAPAAFENGLGSGAFIPYVDAYGNVTFEDCHIKNSTINGNERAAGLVGYTSGQSVTIKNCSVENCEISAVGGAAGLVAYSQSVTTIENCSVKNTKVTATEDREGTKLPLAGAVIGTVNANTTLTNVTVSGNTVSNNNATAVFNDYIGRWVAGELTIDGAVQKTASSQSELNSAVASGNVDVTLADGNYSLPGTNGDVTISGTKDTVITVAGTPTGSDVTFNGVTVKGSGYATGVNTATATYNGATIEGSMFLYGDKVVFNKCTFNLDGDYIWTYGAKEVEFNNCIFNTTGKAILIYKDGGIISTKVTVKGCTFNATAPAYAGAITNQNCAAIEMQNYESSITLITENNTIDSNFSGVWRIKQYDTQNGCTITVNGHAYTQPALDGELMTVTNKEATFD